MVAVIGVLPLLTAVKDPMLPVPLAANPIPGVLFVQLKPVVFMPVKFTGVVDAPAHTVWFAGGLVIEGTGFTVKADGVE